jgi:hypothetical protein
LGPKWYGPFKVMEKTGNVCYRLQLPIGSKAHPIFHVEKLARYFESSDKQRNPPASEPVIRDGGEEYLVDDILDHKLKHEYTGWYNGQERVIMSAHGNRLLISKMMRN